MIQVGAIEDNGILTREQQIFAIADLLHTLLEGSSDESVSPLEQTHSSAREHQP
jgi:hypothetical protein